MAFTRFHDDPCRIQKYLEETTNIGNYNLDVPGYGKKPLYVNDTHIRMQLWGANLSTNQTDLDSELKCLTRKLNKDTIKENNYVNNLNEKELYNKINYPVHYDEITHQPRTTNPAWELRELNSLNTEIPNNFNYLHINPLEHVCIPFQNNISSRIVEKDYYSFNKNM